MDESLENPIVENDLAAVRAILDANPSLVTSRAGDHPIHWAAANDRPEVIELLLGRGADPSARDEDGRTPIHRAAESGVASVRLLLRHRAEVNTVDAWGYTPLTWAISGGQPEGIEIARLLRDAGADYDLRAASAAGDLGRVRALLRDDPGAVARIPPETLLGLAVSLATAETLMDRAEIVKLLLAHGLHLDEDTLRRYAEAFDTSGFGIVGDLLRERLPPSEGGQTAPSSQDDASEDDEEEGLFGEDEITTA